MPGGLDREFSYVLPIRVGGPDAAVALAPYLRDLAEWCDDVIVVDDSAQEVRRANAQLWQDTVTVRLTTPDLSHACLNGKVAGVLTGVDLARHERVVIADNDVRYDRDRLMRTIELLADHDLVRPQNYFSPSPWHACWDTARTLLNRATLGADFPGTLGVRRSRLRAAGGYAGDVLFENLELIRTIRAHDGRIASPQDLYVRRLPPDVRHFLGQRVRQAYDDFAMPARMSIWLAILPLLLRSLPRRGPLPSVAGAVAVMALAERGRRAAGGARFFPPAATLLAPLWVLERACCAWLAVMKRLWRGGIRYSNGVIRVAAHSERSLQNAHRDDASGVQDRVAELRDESPHRRAPAPLTAPDAARRVSQRPPGGCHRRT